jgi:AcrR family transcriptional regulator
MPINPPLQQRSRESLERVLDAGTRLLEEEGFDGFTLQEVSRRSGVSIGAIYARAPNKDSLILAIYDRAMERIGAEQRELFDEAAFEGLDARERVETLVRKSAQLMLEHAAILAVFINRAATEGEIYNRGREQVQRLSEQFEQVLLSHRGEYTHPKPEKAIDACFRVFFATMSRRITRGPSFDSRVPLSDRELVEELSHLCASYLLAPRSA